MNIKSELIKYAKWYDKATMPEDAQTDEADLVQNVESYLQTEGKNIVLSDVSGSLRFSERDVDFAYLCGVFNVSGIDGLHKEIQRLKAIGKDPHDIIEACRKQSPLTIICKH